jgi:parallel beta-helix repeat protein
MNNVTRTANCRRLFLTLSVLAALALFSAPAQATPPVTVHCDQTLTQSVKLANDLSNCPNNGLVVGADNVTVDLNGHTIDGDGELVADCPGFPGPDCDAGVQNTGGYKGVTIEGGKLREFAWGVEVFGGASQNRVRHISATHNLFRGILIGGGITDSQIEGNSTNDNGAGIVLCCSSNNVRIEGNSVSGNGDGIVVRGSDNNRIANNSVSDNTDIGEGSEGSGIGIEGSDNEVSHNRVHGNADNLGVFGNRNRVTANEVTDPVGCPGEQPGELACGHGIQLGGGEGNLVASNRVFGALSDNISVDSFDPDNPTVATVVRDNLVRDAGVDGISVGTDVNGNSAAVTDTLVLRNTAIGSGDDGIDVDSVATTLTRNGAFRNDDLGIEAVPGVTDGGGNKAAGNGNSLQCTNVFCN